MYFIANTDDDYIDSIDNTDIDLINSDNIDFNQCSHSILKSMSALCLYSD
jgi:hypothetical protein